MVSRFGVPAEVEQSVRRRIVDTLGICVAAQALDTSRAESQRFTGRAVVALAADPDVHRKTGRAIPSRDLADEYGFTDVDGSLPDGPMHDRPEGVPGSQPD